MNNQQFNKNSILAFFVTIAGIVVSLFVIATLSQGAFFLPLVTTLLIVSVITAMWLYDYWLVLAIPFAMAPGAIYVAGNLPPFVAVGLAGLAGYFLTNALKLHAIKITYKGNPLFSIAVTTLTAICIYHFLDGRFGIVGSKSVGGMKLAASTLVCSGILFVASIHQIPEKVFRRLPFLAMIPAMLLLLIDSLTIYVPALSSGLSMLYVANWETVAALENRSFEVFRVATLREFGSTLAFTGAVFVGRVPFGTLRGLICYSATTAGLACTLASGYRSAFATASLMVVFALFYRLRLKALPLFFAGLLTLAVLSVGHGQFFELPRQAQRALSFIPGNWDYNIKNIADAGFDWRKDLTALFWSEWNSKDIWIGRGQTIQDSTTMKLMNLVAPTPETGLRILASSQSWHSGYLSTLDMTGAIGVAALAFIMLYGIYLSFQMVTSNRSLPPGVLWLILYFGQLLPIFWYTLGFPHDGPRIVISAIGLSMVWRYGYAKNKNSAIALKHDDLHKDVLHESAPTPSKI